MKAMFFRFSLYTALAVFLILFVSLLGLSQLLIAFLVLLHGGALFLDQRVFP